MFLKHWFKPLLMVVLQEGRAFFKAFDVGSVPSKSMRVFYNPEMVLNRGLTIAFAKAFLKHARIGLPLAATGVRGLRLLLEAPETVGELLLNDKNPKAVSLILENLGLNNLQALVDSKVNILNKNANIFLLENKAFDFVDVDPFGSPNPFLDAAVRASKRFLAVTATDTAVLAGTYPKKCLRAYWSLPLRNALKHEAGVRILIKKCQLIAAQYGKALTPVISYWKRHYYRVFFRVDKSKQRVNELLKQHLFVGKDLQPVYDISKGFKHAYGALWVGFLNHKPVLNNVLKQAENIGLIKEQEFLQKLLAESSIDKPGFVDIHALAKRYKIKNLPKIGAVINTLKDNGFKASRTIYSLTGVRTTGVEEDVLRVVKRLTS